VIADQFPALNQKVNNRELVYLDSAATTQRPKRVIEAINRFYQQEGANVHRGAHELSRRATDLFEDSRKVLAESINAESREFVFTKGCSEAINLAAYSWGLANLNSGDRVLVSTMEHHSNLVPWQLVAEHAGASVEPIPVTDDVLLDLDALEAQLKKGAKLVAVKHVCNVSGTVNPIKEICLLAHEHDAVVVVDGAQSLAHCAVDVKDLDADFYALAGHKAYGPMGIGGLYVRWSILKDMKPWQGGGGMIRKVSFDGTTFAEPPERFEAGTPNVGGAVGFAEAVRFIQDLGIETIAQEERVLNKFAESELSALGIETIGGDPNKAGILSYNVDAIHPHDFGTICDQFGVAIRAGHHCCMPLMKRLGLAASARASLGVYNSKHDIIVMIEAIKEARKIFG
jgi:cysteine desulfurase/selenocysteine lyase